MPVYNEQISELKQSIQSILNQSYKNFEFIIVDDNPRSRLIKRYLLNVSNNNNKIRLFINQNNLGVVPSVNKAIYYSKGKFIARMDADDISSIDRLKKQLSFMKRNNLDFSCCNYVNIDVNNKLCQDSSYCDYTQTNQEKIRHTMSYLNIAIGPTLFFKRDILYEIGNYRNILAEDYDLAVRVLIYGYKVGYLSTPLVYKRCRRNSLSRLNILKEFIILKSISRYIRKNNFTGCIPLHYLYHNECLIRKRDIRCYSLFSYYREKYRYSKSILILIKKYMSLLLSPLVLRSKLFFHFYKFLQDILMK